MKKNLLIISAFLVLTFSANAQDKSWEDGHSAVTVGYGYPNIYKSILKALLENQTNGNYSSGTDQTKFEVKGYGPMFLKYDYAVSKLIGIGASVGYWNTKYTETSTYTQDVYDPNSGYYIGNQTYSDMVKYNFSSLSIGARLNFHFGTGEKIDPYAGVAGGYTRTVFSYTYSSTNPSSTSSPHFSYSGIPVYFAITAGMRYYFTDNIGAYAEVGLDKWSIIQGGLAIKF